MYLQQALEREATVLIVDDEAPVREVVCDFLTLCDVQTVSASDGDAALDVYQSRQEEIGLVLLDLSMPGPSTAEIVARLHALKPTLPIVISSGHGLTVAQERTRNLPISDFLLKPYRFDVLIDLVHRYVH